MCEVRIEVTECSYPSRAGRVPAEPAPSSPCHGSAHPSTPAGSATPSHSYQSSSADRGSHQFVPRPSHLEPISRWGPIDLWVCNTLTPFLAPLPPNFCRARVLSQFKSSHLQPFSNSGSHKRPFPRVSNYIQVSGILDPGKRILFLPGGKVHVHGSKQTVNERNSDRSLDHQAGL